MDSVGLVLIGILRIHSGSFETQSRLCSVCAYLNGINAITESAFAAELRINRQYASKKNHDPLGGYINLISKPGLVQILVALAQ